MNELNRILAEATAAIKSPYFLLPIAGDESVYRERVYCYELYRQMRKRWPRDCRFVLNGEVDKRAHRGLKARGVKGQKPDLLVHHPGDEHSNHAIIEVKSAKGAQRGSLKDIRTLALFLDRVEYRRGIYLIYGEGADQRFAEKTRAAAANIEGSGRIEMWLHSQVGELAKMQFKLGD